MAKEQTTGDGPWLRLISCARTQQGAASSLQSYTEQLAALLRGRLYWQPVAGSQSPEVTKRDLRQYDLVIVNEAGWLSWTRPSGQMAAPFANQEQQPSLLLVREPCWPLRRLLLLIRGQATDRATIEWGVYLAQRARCNVTLLVVKPPILDERDHFIAQALKANTVPGRHIRYALHQFATNQVTGVLKLSHTGAERQVQAEVTDSLYDLIILGNEPLGRLFSWRLDSLLTPLLQWTQQPLLIAGVTSPWSRDSKAGEVWQA